VFVTRSRKDWMAYSNHQTVTGDHSADGNGGST
jgi:hypothetical protein